MTTRISSRDGDLPQVESNLTDQHLIPKVVLSTQQNSMQLPQSPRSSNVSLSGTDSSNDSDASPTPTTEPQLDTRMDHAVDGIDTVSDLPIAGLNLENLRERRASTSLISQDGEELRRILGNGESGTKLIQKYCCGGGCCSAPDQSKAILANPDATPITLPDNQAFKSLGLRLGGLSLDTELTKVTSLPEENISFDTLANPEVPHISTVSEHPPKFVQPHAPFDVFSAPVHDARELTKPGAEKRTFHFDLDVTDYPFEVGVDFRVGGAVGICPPNADEVVNDIFDTLGVLRAIRDKPILLRTQGGRWPTIWGQEEPRTLVTTRRELLTWCCDVQSTPPTKPLLRLLAEYASDPVEKKILLFLTSAEGQGVFCDLRTGPHITLSQLLHAFPSSKPPLPFLMSVIKQLMPRFYSLSNDPHISSARDDLGGRRIIEMAVSIHETPDWHNGTRTGVGSGFLERVAEKFIAAKASANTAVPAPTFRVPLFRGLMSNPLSREFVSDGPMLLIGAGVGMAPFRGFILNRLKNANCANKVWLLQGVRDAKLDELYHGELGSHEGEIKRVVQSRKPSRAVGEAKYVQDEVRNQADIVWSVIKAVDGRIFVCGSSQGMGEGVHESLVEVIMEKASLNREQAEAFWTAKKEGGQYIMETW